MPVTNTVPNLPRSDTFNLVTPSSGPFALTYPVYESSGVLADDFIVELDGAPVAFSVTKATFVQGVALDTEITLTTPATGELVIASMRAPRTNWNFQTGRPTSAGRWASVFNALTASVRDVFDQLSASIARESSRAVRVPPGESIPALPVASTRAGKVMEWSVDGQSIILKDPPSGGVGDGFSLPDPFYLLWLGQSNALGSNGGANPNWITETGRVFVLVPSTGQWVDAAGRQGLEPFNLDGSNCPAVHLALKVAREQGVTVRIVMAVQGSTELNQWTGGGYNNGVAIPTDRTVSVTNRVQFKKAVDAVTAMSIPQFHAVGFWQGEADFATPESVYLSELAFLLEDSKALGLASDMTRRFPMVVFGLYTGVLAGQQATRSASLEKFARINPGVVDFVATEDLQGRDDGIGIINHFVAASYTTAGERGAGALLRLWLGGGYLSDQRLKGIVIPASGTGSEKIGYRTYDAQTITNGTLNLSIDAGQMRGEVYTLSGTCTVNLDATANAALGHAGLHFEFVTLSNADSVTFNASPRVIQMLGDGSTATSMTITNVAGRGRVVYEGSRYVIDLVPRNAHSQGVIESGANTTRRIYSPLELRQASTAAIRAFFGINVLTSDANSSVTVAQGRVVIDVTVLTAARTRTLSNTGAVAGDVFEYTRKGGGAFVLTLRDLASATTITTLDVSDRWARCVFDGTNWQLVAKGTLA